MAIRLLLRALLIHFCVIVSSQKMRNNTDAVGWYGRVALIQNELDKIVQLMDESSVCAEAIRTERATLIDMLLGYWWQDVSSVLGIDLGIEKSKTDCFLETEQTMARFMKRPQPKTKAGTKHSITTSVSKPKPTQQGTKNDGGNYKCPKNWKYLNRTKSCYRAVHGIYKFIEASEACRRERSTLASITTPAEQDFVNAFFEKNEMYWIGLHKFSGEWNWEDGSSVNYTNWREGEPNGCCGHPPACVIANYKNSTGQWDDGSCAYRTNPVERQSYICKKLAILKS